MAEYHNDPTTIAYIAIGAKEALKASGNFPKNYQGGELEFIGECIQHARLLDKEAPDECAGVFAYEIAEPFGEQYAKALIEGKQPDPKELMQKIMKEAGW